MTGIEDCRDRVPSSPPRGRLDSHLRAPASDWLQNEYIPFPNLPFSSSCRSSFCQFHFLTAPNPILPPELRRQRISAADFPLDNEILTSAAFHGSGVLRVGVIARPDEFSSLLGFHAGVGPKLRGLAVEPEDHAPKFFVRDGVLDGAASRGPAPCSTARAEHPRNGARPAGAAVSRRRPSVGEPALLEEDQFTQGIRFVQGVAVVQVRGSLALLLVASDARPLKDGLDKSMIAYRLHAADLRLDPRGEPPQRQGDASARAWLPIYSRGTPADQLLAGMHVGVGSHRLHGHAAIINRLEVDRHADRSLEVRAAVLLHRHAPQAHPAQLLLAKADWRPIAEQAGLRAFAGPGLMPQPLDPGILGPGQIGAVNVLHTDRGRGRAGSSARSPWQVPVGIVGGLRRGLMGMGLSSRQGFVFPQTSLKEQRSSRLPNLSNR